MQVDSMTLHDAKNEISVPSGRVKIHIRCRQCGEVFILRGVKDHRGHVETGDRKSVV